MEDTLATAREAIEPHLGATTPRNPYGVPNGPKTSHATSLSSGLKGTIFESPRQRPGQRSRLPIEPCMGEICLLPRAPHVAPTGLERT
jgi:hypothetical protein